MTIQEFINKYNGDRIVGDTDVNRGECVGLVEVWLDTIGAPHIWGNACDLAINADRNAYTIIPNTPDYVPQPGVIGVLPAGWGGSAVGHTFIVAPGTTINTLVAFEQNDQIGGGNGSSRIYDHLGWPDGLVFIVPHVLSVAAPVLEAAVTPIEAVPLPATEQVTTSDPAPAVTPDTAPEPVSPAPVDDVAPSDISVIDQSNIEHIPIVVPVKENIMDSIKDQLLSKKFIAFLLLEIPLLLNQQWGDAVVTALTYFGVQGAIDHKNAG